MALRTCPDCNSNVSDRGMVCINCGRRLSVEYRILGLPFFMSTNPPSKTRRMIILTILGYISYRLFFSTPDKDDKITNSESYKSKKYESRNAAKASSKSIYKVKANELAKF
jgi:hypothetical protein